MNDLDRELAAVEARDRRDTYRFHLGGQLAEVREIVPDTGRPGQLAIRLEVLLTGDERTSERLPDGSVRFFTKRRRPSRPARLVLRLDGCGLAALAARALDSKSGRAVCGPITAIRGQTVRELSFPEKVPGWPPSGDEPARSEDGTWEAAK